jgi:hypothetical protein
MRFCITALMFLLIFSFHRSFAQSNELLTPYESGGFNITPTYNETIEFSKLLARSSKHISYSTIGKSARGRRYSTADSRQGGTVRSRENQEEKRGIVLIIACIHPGEPDGKDAGFLLFRDIACGKRKQLIC